MKYPDKTKWTSHFYQNHNRKQLSRKRMKSAKWYIEKTAAVARSCWANFLKKSVEGDYSTIANNQKILLCFLLSFFVSWTIFRCKSPIILADLLQDIDRVFAIIRCFLWNISLEAVFRKGFVYLTQNSFVLKEAIPSRKCSNIKNLL